MNAFSYLMILFIDRMLLVAGQPLNEPIRFIFCGIDSSYVATRTKKSDNLCFENAVRIKPSNIVSNFILCLILLDDRSFMHAIFNT